MNPENSNFNFIEPINATYSNDEQKITPIRPFSRLKLFFFIFLIFMLSGGTYGILNLREIKEKNTEPIMTSVFPTPKPPTTITSTPTPIDVTASWKTYTNKEYGFEIKYPRVAKVFQNSESWSKSGECGKGIKQGFTESDKTENGFVQQYEHQIFIDNFTTIRIKKWDKSINEYIKSQKADGFWETKIIQESNADEAIKLNQTKALKPYEGYPPLSYVDAIYKKNGKLFFLMSSQGFNSLDGCVLESDLKESVNSTFKFIDNLADWKTYKNEEHGFEFKYPSQWTIKEESTDLGPSFSVSCPICGGNFDSINIFQVIFKTPEEYCSSLGYTDTSCTIESLNGVQVFKRFNDGSPQAPPEVSYFVIHRSKGWILSLTGLGKEDKPNPNILSTFKFTD